jgi:hypothetical protein
VNPRIAELVGKLDSLSEDELRELAGLIVEEADKLDGSGDSIEAAAAMHKLAGFASKLTALRAGRTLDGFRQSAVTASGARESSVATVARGRRPLGRNPEAARVAGHGSRVLLATGAGSWGEEVIDRYELARVMCEHLQRMNRGRPSSGVSLVASALTEYPEERQLGSDAMLNLRRLDAAVGMSALLATGGICLPTNVDYAIPTWASARRPLKEGLPAFAASRGGLLFIEPPNIAALGAATGIWTEATDAEPLGATKPVFSVSCGATLQVYVNAVTTRIGFGNMQSRFQPELVAANTDLAIAAAARKAELKLLELIQEKALKDVTSTKVLGATRDLVTCISQAVSAYRFTYRIDRNIGLTGIFPEWVKDLVKIDLARESAHQQGTDWNTLAITDEQVEDVIRAAGVNPIFTLDGLPAEGSTYPTQNFAVQAASEAIKAFPTKLVWNLFVEGSVQFLDGGRLDLGVVRDTTLDATNDYEVFSETFEGIADRGFSKAILQMVTELCANGKSGATETVSTCA